MPVVFGTQVYAKVNKYGERVSPLFDVKDDPEAEKYDGDLVEYAARQVHSVAGVRGRKRRNLRRSIFENIINYFMDLKGMKTYTELAQWTGVSSSTVQQWLSGKVIPADAVLDKIMSDEIILKEVSPDWLKDGLFAQSRGMSVDRFSLAGWREENVRNVAMGKEGVDYPLDWIKPDGWVLPA